MTWHTAKVTYFAKNKAALLNRAIRPAIEKVMAAGIDQIYLKRHWKFGPHVDVYFNCTQQQFEEKVFPTFKETVETWLADNPSNEKLDPKAYEQLSTKLGALEFEKGPYLPLLEDNQVLLGSYNSNEVLLQGEAMVAAKERFNVGCLPILLELIKQAEASEGELIATLVRMMCCIGEFFPNVGLKRGHFSFRSHAESYLVNYDPTGQTRTAFAQVEKQTASQIDSIVAVTVTEFANETFYREKDPLMHQWCEQLGTLQAEVTKVIEAQGEETMANRNFYRDLAQEVGDEAMAFKQETADFHEDFMDKVEGDQFVKSKIFLVYRQLINQFYFFLPLMSVSPVKKNLLCHLIANACERFYGQTWKEQMDEWSQQLEKIRSRKNPLGGPNETSTL